MVTGTNIETIDKYVQFLSRHFARTRATFCLFPDQYFICIPFLRALTFCFKYCLDFSPCEVDIWFWIPRLTRLTLVALLITDGIYLRNGKRHLSEDCIALVDSKFFNSTHTMCLHMILSFVDCCDIHT